MRRRASLPRRWSAGGQSTTGTRRLAVGRSGHRRRTMRGMVLLRNREGDIHQKKCGLASSRLTSNLTGRGTTLHRSMSVPPKGPFRKERLDTGDRIRTIRKPKRPRPLGRSARRLDMELFHRRIPQPDLRALEIPLESLRDRLPGVMNHRGHNYQRPRPMGRDRSQQGLPPPGLVRVQPVRQQAMSLPILPG